MAIALSVENDFHLCTNEGPARKQATALKIELTGTLGIIAAAYQNEIINEEQARQYFIYLSKEGSCYTSPALLQKVLNELGLQL